MHRDPDYDPVEPGSAYAEPSGSTGYWIVSLDQMSGHVWVQGAAKHGVITFGRMVAAGRKIWYGANPETHDGTTHFDNGLAGGTFLAGQVAPGDSTPNLEPAGLIIDPDQMLEVLVGSRVKSNVQYTTKFNWNSLWSVPMRSMMTNGTYPTNGFYPVIVSPQGQPATSAYDPVTQRVLWLIPEARRSSCCSDYPVIAVWDMLVD
jgi:hypothetical protein